MKTFNKHKQLNHPSNSHGKRRVNQYQGLFQLGSYRSPSGGLEGEHRGTGLEGGVQIGRGSTGALNGSVALGMGKI